MRMRWLWLTILVVALGSGGYYGWSFFQNQPKASAAPANVIPGPVRRSSLRSFVSDTGPVVPGVTLPVRSEVAAVVAQVLAKPGDIVKAGQVVIELTSDTITTALEQARLELRNAQITLDEALKPTTSQIDQQLIKVEQAQLAVKTRKADIEALTVTAPMAGMVTGVRALVGDQVNSGGVVLTLYDDQNLKVDVQIPQALAQDVRVGQEAEIFPVGMERLVGSVVELSALAQGSGRESTVPVSVRLPATPGLRPGMITTVSISTGRDGDSVQWQGTVAARTRMDVKAKGSGQVKSVAVAEGMRVKAGATLVVLENDALPRQLAQAENDLKSAQLTLDGLRNVDAATPAMESRRVRIEQAQVTLASREREAANLKIRAPADGTITELTIKPGDRVTVGQAVFKVNDFRALDVVLGVDELDLPKIKVGQDAQISLDALPRQSFKGKITDIAPEGRTQDGIATFDVTVRVAEPGAMRTGMTAKVEIPLDSRENVLVVPAQAVITRGTQTVVRKVAADGSIQDVPVKVGLNAGVQVEIMDGVQEGEMIVYSTALQTQQQGMRLPGFGGFGGGAPPPGNFQFKTSGPPGGGGAPAGGGGGARK